MVLYKVYIINMIGGNTLETISMILSISCVMFLLCLIIELIHPFFLKSRFKAFIILGIPYIVLLILSNTISSAYLIDEKDISNEKVLYEPQRVITNYYKYISNGDYESAYNLLCKSDKSKYTKTQFVLYHIMLDKNNHLKDFEINQQKLYVNKKLNNIKYSQIIDYSIKEKQFILSENKDDFLKYNRKVILENNEWEIVLGSSAKLDIEKYAKLAQHNFERDNSIFDKDLDITLKYLHTYNNQANSDTLVKLYNNLIKYKVVYEAKKNKIEQKTNEKWTKDNIVCKLNELNVLNNMGSFINIMNGSKVYKLDTSIDGKTNIKNPIKLELSIISTDNIIITDKEICTKIVYNIVYQLNQNKNKMDFNLCLVGVHFYNANGISKTTKSNWDNFYLGVNTIQNYFTNPRTNKIAISEINGSLNNLDFDSDSFYKWIEDNFTLPEDPAVLAENTSWSTISSKSSLE